MKIIIKIFKTKIIIIRINFNIIDIIIILHKLIIILLYKNIIINI